jgi:hypothetical protein
MLGCQNLFSIIDWISCIIPQKSGRTRAGMQVHINNPMKQVGFWAVDELKVSWDDNAYTLICKESH